ncbi:MAG: hypothetical protein HYU73_26745 [Betaproteobacteria bacterium]|nr:hypothetical protein [Betaproteobacteria bacterium]
MRSSGVAADHSAGIILEKAIRRKGRQGREGKQRRRLVIKTTVFSDYIRIQLGADFL